MQCCQRLSTSLTSNIRPKTPTENNSAAFSALNLEHKFALQHTLMMFTFE